MIIKYVESNLGFWFFSKPKVTVVTDEGQGSADGKLDAPVLVELNTKLKDYNVFSAEDFVNLKKIIGDNYKIIETCLINSSPSLWQFFNEEANVIPRPMGLVLRKSAGIREFYTISLNCNDFQQAVYANERIAEFVKSKLYAENIIPDEKGLYHNVEDKKVFEVLQNGIKEIAKTVTFNIRIGVNFKADSARRSIDEQFKYVVDLVFGENILFAINPLDLKEVDEYKRLKEKVLGDCYIAVSSFERFDKESCDFAAIKENDLADVTAAVKKIKEKGLNILFDGGPDVCVGFGFPILKTGYRDKETEAKISRINQIFEEIREKKQDMKANPVSS